MSATWYVHNQDHFCQKPDASMESSKWDTLVAQAIYTSYVRRIIHGVQNESRWHNQRECRNPVSQNDPFLEHFNEYNVIWAFTLESSKHAFIVLDSYWRSQYFTHFHSSGHGNATYYINHFTACAVKTKSSCDTLDHLSKTRPLEPFWHQLRTGCTKKDLSPVCDTPPLIFERKKWSCFKTKIYISRATRKNRTCAFRFILEYTSFCYCSSILESWRVLW